MDVQTRKPLGGNRVPTIETLALVAPEWLSYPSERVREFVKRVADSVYRKRATSQDRFRPRRLLLMYVPAPSAPALLEEFGFAPLPISVHSEHQDWRKDGVRACELFLAQLREVLSFPKPIAELRHAIEASGGRGAPALPPRNFVLKPRPFIEKLRELRADLSGLSRLEAAVQTVRHGRKGIRVPVDARKRVFPSDLSGHGLPRESPSCPRRELERLYRFGFPLRDGFHHDVARQDGADFRDEPFECSERGEVTVCGTHANVYPDDYVRAPDVK